MTLYEQIQEREKQEKRKGPNGEVPSEGKVFLRIPHYRLVEIDESELDDVINIIKNNGDETYKEFVIQTFFRLMKKQTFSSETNRLNDREVLERWKQFKETSTCLLKPGDVRLC